MGLVSNLKYIKLYLKLSPLIDKLKETLKMKFSTNMVIQAVAVIGQITNIIAPGITSTNGKLVIAIILGVVQGITSAVAHVSTPSGNSIPPEE